jgi:hypothetical protein
MAAQTMKAISLHQPFGSYIILGKKKYETRDWHTSYRGLIAIHAARKWDDETIANNEGIHRRFPAIPQLVNPPLGAMLGICRLLDCVRTESIKPSEHERAVGGWGQGRFAWEMEVLEIFDPAITAKGEPKIFDWELPADFLANRIAIVGSRDYPDLDAVKRYVYSLDKNITIVSGGARGVDTVAVETARERGMKTVVIPVNQRGLPEGGVDRNNIFGQRAMIRNGEIVQMVGTVAAFHHNGSPGTKNTIERAEKAGKTVLINPNVVAKEAVAKQLMFEGFKSTYDEGAYITALERAKHFSPEDEKTHPLDFEWEWPWLATKRDVWVKAKGGAYRLVPIESDEAKRWGNTLRGWMYQSETHNLREWLKANADKDENFIALPCDHFDLNQYAIDDALHAVKGSDIRYGVTPVEKITFTQRSYNPGICLKYLEAGTVKEFDSGLLPMLYRFGEDEHYFMTNGTHRGVAWLMGLDPSRRAALPIRFAHIPQSLEALQEQAIELSDEEERLELIAELLREAYAILQQDKEELELVTT